jgi:hypothetical protein
VQARVSAYKMRDTLVPNKAPLHRLAVLLESDKLNQLFMKINHTKLFGGTLIVKFVTLYILWDGITMLFDQRLYEILSFGTHLRDANPDYLKTANRFPETSLRLQT